MIDANCSRTIADTENHCKMDPGTFFGLSNTIGRVYAMDLDYYLLPMS